MIFEYDDVIYANINGVGCGTLRTTGVNNVKSQPNQISVYPNPATTALTIQSTNKINQIIITNLIGQTVYTLTCNTEQVQVNVANLPGGVYFVKINGSEVKKFVKE